MTPTDNPTETKGPAPRRRGRAPSFRKIVRRIHLYSGILLMPWVLLYGISGIFFNHPTLLSGTTHRDLGPEQLRETAFANPPALEDVAGQLIEGINARLPEAERLQLDPEQPIRITRKMTFEVHDEDGKHKLDFDPASATARLSTFPPNPPRDFLPLDHTDPLPVAAWPGRDAWMEAAATVYAREGRPEGSIQHRGGPTLRFGATSGEQRWALRYDFGRDWLHSRNMEAADDLTFRTLLLRLHLAHEYPSGSNLRTVWAILVDLMGVTMIIWALSGLYMWWPMKRLRREGFLALALCLLLVWWLGGGMAVLVGW